MKHHYPIVILGLLFLSFAPLEDPEHLYYDVYFGDSRVGSMEVIRQQRHERHFYRSHGKVEISLLFTVELEFINQVEFEDGNLFSSLTKNLRGGDLTDMSTGQKQGHHFRNRVNDQVKIVELPIQYTLLNIYYEEPVERKVVYSERSGIFLEIRSKGNHQYSTTQYTGYETRYTYCNGRCCIMEVDHLLGTLKFQLRH